MEKKIDDIQNQDINTLDDALSAVQKSNGKYPKSAVEFLANNKEEATPKLLEILSYTLDNYQTLEADYCAALHAMFLLAQFREKKAFSYIIKIASLPEKYLDILLCDTITEDLHNIIASVYDGDLQQIKNIIENPEVTIWPRNAALNSLLVLVKEEILDRSEVVNYLKSLFNNESFTSDYEIMSFLIWAACDLYPEEVYDEIKNAFQKELVDESIVSMTLVDRILNLGKQETLNHYLYDDSHFGFIDSAVDSMSWWVCFQEQEKYQPIETDHDKFDFSPGVENYSPPDDDVFSYEHTPFRRSAPKIGRNDPCPCGSGKKYKKCCL